MTSTKKPAIVIIAYNRIDSVRRLMSSLNEAYYPVDDICLIVCIDYSDSTSRIISTIQDIGWNHGSLIFRNCPKHMGLKDHIISCGDLTDIYDSIIMLEDDLYVSPGFYVYSLQMLDRYGNDERIMNYSLYCHAWNGYAELPFIPQRNEYDVFIAQIGAAWGQCWTRNQWKQFKVWYDKNKCTESFDNDIPKEINNWGDQSWCKYLYNYLVESGKYIIFPYISLTTNFQDVGVHYKE